MVWSNDDNPVFIITPVISKITELCQQPFFNCNSHEQGSNCGCVIV